MREPTEIEKQQYERFKELFALSRQRYLDAGGNSRRCPSGRKEDDYLTDEERKELFAIGEQIFGVQVKNGYVYCQGQSWKMPEKQELKREESEVSG